MPTLLVLGSPEDRSLDRLRGIEGLRVGVGADAAAIASDLGGVEALHDAEVLMVARGRREILDEVLLRAPRLRWIHVRSAGIDHLVSPALAAAPIVLTNGKGTFSADLADFAMAGILHFRKDVPRMQRAKDARLWDRYEPEALGGTTLGLVGYGDIGRAVARRARAFDMTVLATRRRPSADDDGLGVRFLHGPRAVIEMMGASDAVVVAAALTPETRGLVSAEAIAALRPHAVLINVARGAVVDEPALVDALRAHRIRGAVLDVFSEEPLPPDHPLWALDNVLLSPHCADNVAGWQDVAVGLFLDNLERFRRGEPLVNRVDVARGY